MTEITAEAMTVDLKLFDALIAISDGKIIKLDIKSAPIICIPTTTVTAVKTAISVVYISVFCPIAFEKLSSNVMAKMRLYKSKYIIKITAVNTTLTATYDDFIASIEPNI